MVNLFASTYNYPLSFSGLYYGVSICLVTFASALAVVTLNLHHRGVRGTRVPGIVRSLVLDKLARIVLLNFQEERRSVRSVRSLNEDLFIFLRCHHKRCTICIRNRSNRQEEKTIVHCIANRSWPNRNRRPSS